MTDDLVMFFKTPFCRRDFDWSICGWFGHITKTRCKIKTKKNEFRTDYWRVWEEESISYWQVWPSQSHCRNEQRSTAVFCPATPAQQHNITNIRP